MTYRGIVKNGVIVLDDDAPLPDGTVVEVAPLDSNARSLAEHPAFGIWRLREDMGDPVEASRRLREELERRGRDG